MEYISGGDLETHIKQAKELIPETTLWEYSYDLLNGLQYLHSHKLVHRDIKCQNIFICKDGTLKVRKYREL